eukprot:scaffold24953_cov211-Cylindrotheca_fusiformis.AAC.2
MSQFSLRGVWSGNNYSFNTPEVAEFMRTNEKDSGNIQDISQPSTTIQNANKIPVDDSPSIVESIPIEDDLEDDFSCMIGEESIPMILERDDDKDNNDDDDADIFLMFARFLAFRRAQQEARKKDDARASPRRTAAFGFLQHSQKQDLEPILKNGRQQWTHNFSSIPANVQRGISRTVFCHCAHRTVKPSPTDGWALAMTWKPPVGWALAMTWKPSPTVGWALAMTWKPLVGSALAMTTKSLVGTLLGVSLGASLAMTTKSL